MHPNGTAAPPRPAEDLAAGDLFIPMTDEWRAILADHRWINEQQNRNAFSEYRREFIAVVDKKVLGHGKRYKELRDRVARETGIPESRIVIELILNVPIDW